MGRTRGRHPTLAAVNGRELGTVLTVIFEGGLLIWIADGIVRGVNPWRRCLGDAVAIYQLATPM